VISVAVSLALGEHYAMEEWMGILAMSLLVVILIQAVIMPVRIRFDSEKHKMAMLIVCGVMAAVFGGCYALAEANGIDVDGFLDGILLTKTWMLLAGVILLGALLMFISYKISLKLMAKREF